METLKQTNLRLRKRLIKLANMVRIARHSADHDVLTGLPNRRLFEDRLTQAMALAGRQRRHLAVLMIDLDGFKAINDRLGHAAGDQLLKLVAKRLTACLRATDTASRLGGDEFAVMLPEIRGKKSVPVVIEKIKKTLAAPYPVAKEKLAVGASVGVALHKGKHQLLGHLIEQADKEMYRIKEMRRGSSTEDGQTKPVPPLKPALKAPKVSASHAPARKAPTRSAKEAA
ncbi:GGDEF domain-containing protein [Andreprevotia chitinilytica]|uniref:GGDEF domain-containing protein n=1 Tax=Andreprevotia chitinilytica TaxID=396808 RepID=UPI00068CDA6D|nr:GGDEF domain-containing protein [Andreprevotia chitinilytica]